MKSIIYFFQEKSTREEIMDDVKWILLLTAAITIQMGLFALLLGKEVAFQVLSIGAVYIVGAFIPFYWVRFGFLLVWLGGVIFDYAMRHNPVGIFFILVGLAYAFQMIRCHDNASGEQVPP